MGKQNPIQNKGVIKLIIKNKWRTWSKGRGCNWRKATMVSFDEIVGVMGRKALPTWLYSLVVPKVKHWRRRMAEIVQGVVKMKNIGGMKGLFLKKWLVTHHKPPKVGENLLLTWTTSSNIVPTPTWQHEEKEPR